MALSVNKNMIDKDEYPQTAEIERRCVHMMADLWNAPEAANTVGASAIGSSEACMLAGHGGQVAVAGQAAGRGQAARTSRTWCAARCRWCGTSSPATGTSRCARSRWRTAATAWTPSTMLERVDENTIMVVPTLGVTYTGAYEPVAEMAAALDELQADTGLDIDIHVDGASGGFLAPFCAPEVAFDFRLPRVKSISASGHKFGLAPLGRRLGRLAGPPGTARRPGVPRQLPGRRHAGVPDQLLPAGRADHRPVLQLPAAGLRGLPAHPPGLLRDRPVPGRRDRQAGPVRAAVRQRPGHRDTDGHLAHRARARTPGTPCSTWPTGCAPAAGRCPPTPSPGRRPTSRCSASWSDWG